VPECPKNRCSGSDTRESFCNRHNTWVRYDRSWRIGDSAAPQAQSPNETAFCDLKKGVGSHRGLRACFYGHLAQCQNKSLPETLRPCRRSSKTPGDTAEKCCQEKRGMTKAKFRSDDQLNRSPPDCQKTVFLKRCEAAAGTKITKAMKGRAKANQ